jgi:4-hydroxy-tetrahydrodipicolinate reductase
VPIPVLINGSEGKMGKEIVKSFQHDPEFEVVATTDKKDNLAEAIAQSHAKIVIDFTAASAGFQNASIIINAGAHPVIGTTGFLPDQIEELQKRCARKKLGGIIAPNFSIGALLLMQFAQQAVRYYPAVEIIEMHHNTKEETPSGTAVRTADLITKARLTEANPLKKYKEIIPQARGANYQEIAIHSVRLPGLVAHETIMFGGRGETLTLRHDSMHRESFMPGIKLACKKVLELKELAYGLEQFL